MSSPDLFLQSITLMMMIAISVMPATAAITIHSVLFLSPAAPCCASASGSLAAGVKLKAVKSQNYTVKYSHSINGTRTSLHLRLIFKLKCHKCRLKGISLHKPTLNTNMAY